MIGPTVPFSDELHGTKYRGEGEDFRESQNRFASATSDDPEHYQRSRKIYQSMRFMGGGRTQAAMGSMRIVAAHNCFVSGVIEDSFVDGHGSIMGRAHEAAATMRLGGGIGFDFSTLRPRGAIIRKLQSQSSGPVSFMDIYDAVCRCTASSGHRRGAMMGVLRIDHPDIEEFIHAKQNQTRLTGFNLSVAVTDKFMECLASDTPFPLEWGGEVYKHVQPAALWDMLMRSTWDWAEPGVIFIDTINRMNNLYYCEKIAATNPCGEQPLPPYGACLLGSFALPRYLRRTGIGQYEFDYDLLAADIPDVVRSMDNIIDRANYPTYEQEKEAKSKRRMGLGVTGLANCIEALGHPYGSPGFLEIQDRILAFITNHCYEASVELAKEKGPFPLFNHHYLMGQFVQTRPRELQKKIAAHGIRNSHLISIAPTGTISLCADNMSSGVEPVFAHNVKRVMQTFDRPVEVEIPDYGVNHLGVHGKVASDVTVAEHLGVLVVANRHTDSSVSKTCNVPGTTTWEEFKQIYFDAWQQGCKGCTTFRIDGKRTAMMTSSDEQSEACYLDTETGRRECG